MKIFHVSRHDRAGYDEYSDFVVIAKDEKAARNTHPAETGYKFTKSAWRIEGSSFGADTGWPAPSSLDVAEIGTADNYKEGKPIIVCASFHAG